MKKMRTHVACFSRLNNPRRAVFGGRRRTNERSEKKDGEGNAGKGAGTEEEEKGKYNERDIKTLLKGEREKSANVAV